MATLLLAQFPELSHLSREEFEDLLTNPVYFQAMFHSLHRVKELYQYQADLGMANEAIARNNMALQEVLYQLRSETLGAFNEAKSLEERWKTLEKEQKEVYQRFTPQFLLMRLRHSVTAQDEASEALATTFVQQQPTPSGGSGSGTGTPMNGTEVDLFVQRFKEVRKIYHKRAIWSDKWANGQVAWRED